MKFLYCHRRKQLPRPDKLTSARLLAVLTPKRQVGTAERCDGCSRSIFRRFAELKESEETPAHLHQRSFLGRWHQQQPQASYPLRRSRGTCAGPDQTGASREETVEPGCWARGEHSHGTLAWVAAVLRQPPATGLQGGGSWRSFPGREALRRTGRSGSALLRP